MKKRIVLLSLLLVGLAFLWSVSASADNTAYCAHCRENVQWLPLSQNSTEGHYYVTEKEQLLPCFSLQGSLCLDLRGNTLKAMGDRVFHLRSGSEVSLQDSTGGGLVCGSYTGSNGGTVLIEKNASFHLYGGTLTNTSWQETYAKNGGVVYCDGAFYIHSGSVADGTCTWLGGNVYLSESGTMQLSGGNISGGTGEVAHSGCVLSRGIVTLSGDATITKLRLWPKNSSPPLSESLVISGSYTGHVDLYLGDVPEGTDIGNVTNDGFFPPDAIKLLGQKTFPYICGSDILAGKKAAAIYGSSGFEGYTDTVASAVAACQGTDKTLVLKWETGEAITISKDICIDLEGNNWTVPLTVAEGATLYLKDSANDDFKETFGRIASVSGTVKTLPGYKLYTDASGISAHAYDLRITSAALRPTTKSMYFIGSIKGDQQLESQVFSYGIALDVNREPSRQTLNKSSKHTSIRYGFDRNFGITSVLLTGILKAQNTTWENARNADITVYCRPFIRFTDDEIVFGDTKAISFRELLELADQKWTQQAVPKDLQALYLEFEDSMTGWNIPNLKQAAKVCAPSPYRVPTPMTMERINSLPIATEDMTVDELRQLCIDFFRLQLTFQWVSESDMGYDIRQRHALIPAGRVNGGSPYSARAKSGNLYMTMEFYDEATGVIRNPGMTDHNFVWLFGNHCTYGPFWGWQRVINSTTAQFNWNMGMESYGYIPLGDFSTAGMDRWEGGVTDTDTVGKAMGEQAVYEAYALVEKADCLYAWYSAEAVSHMLMASRDAVVVRNPDGTINGEESYIIYMDQGGSWRERDLDGDTVTVQGGLDDPITFASLYSGYYLPFTFREFHGLDPVEAGEVSSSLEGLSTVTPRQLSEATLKANYAISHVTVSITDENGKELYRQNAFSPRINTMEMSISDAVDTPALEALASRHCTVTCRIGNGEIFTLFDGTLTAN